MGVTYVFVLLRLDRKERRVVATVSPIMGLGHGKAEEFMGSELATKLLRFLNENHVLTDTRWFRVGDNGAFLIDPDVEGDAEDLDINLDYDSEVLALDDSGNHYAVPELMLNDGFREMLVENRFSSEERLRYYSFAREPNMFSCSDGTTFPEDTPPDEGLCSALGIGTAPQPKRRKAATSE